jgi:DNA polymerase III alpha subunit (gram-positive type)
MNYENPVFFDVETSGLDWKKHEIIQLAAYAPATEEYFNEYIQFDVSKADKTALEINHYNEELWKKKAIDKVSACSKFRDFLCGHKSVERISKKNKKYAVAVLSGHCAAKFDMPFLVEMFQDCNEFLPADFRCYDTMQLALWGLHDLTDYTLEGLTKYFDISYMTAVHFHDARTDARYNATVAAYLLRSLRAPMPGWAKKEIKSNIEFNNIPF